MAVAIYALMGEAGVVSLSDTWTDWALVLATFLHWDSLFLGSWEARRFRCEMGAATTEAARPEGGGEFLALEWVLAAEGMNDLLRPETADDIRVGETGPFPLPLLFPFLPFGVEVGSALARALATGSPWRAPMEMACTRTDRRREDLCTASKLSDAHRPPKSGSINNCLWVPSENR